jgi:hypothetical protein
MLDADKKLRPQQLRLFAILMRHFDLHPLWSAVVIVLDENLFDVVGIPVLSVNVQSAEIKMKNVSLFVSLVNLCL